MHYRWDRYQHFWTAILTCQGGKPLKQHLVHGTLHYRAPKGSCCEFLNWKRTELLLRSLKICFCSPTDPQEQLACWSNTAISHCQFRGTLCRYDREERWCDTLHLFLVTPLKKSKAQQYTSTGGEHSCSARLGWLKLWIRLLLRPRLHLWLNLWCYG